MRFTKPLTDREKLVLYGLTRYPQRPDVYIAEQLEMPQPTFSNIQRRLKKKGYYQTITIPDMMALGLETVAVAHGDYNPMVSFEERKEVEDLVWGQFPELFQRLSGINSFALLLTSRSHKDMEHALDGIEASYLEKDIIEGDGLQRIIISLPTSMLPSWFELSRPLFSKFKLERFESIRPHGTKAFPFERTSRPKLSKSEGLILLYLLENPDTTDIRIAKDLGISRTTVLRTRKKLTSTGLLKRMVIPNLQILGFEVLVMAHARFGKDTGIEERHRSQKSILDRAPILFSILSEREGVTFAAMESYHDLQKIKRDGLLQHKRSGYDDGDIEFLIFSFSELVDPTPPRFAPMVKKVLELNG